MRAQKTGVLSETRQLTRPAGYPTISAMNQTPEPQPIVGYIVHATRTEPGEKLRIREYLVGIPNRDAAAGAVISAYPDLDDGFHVEASFGLTIADARRFSLSEGEIRIGDDRLEG